MAEHPLDVEQVEVVRTVVGRGPVEDGCGGATEVVRGDVSESGGLAPLVDDEERARADGVVPVEASWYSLTGCSGLLTADQRVLGTGFGVVGEVAPDGVHECCAGGHGTGTPALAGPGDRRQRCDIDDPQRRHLTDAHASKSEAHHDLVTETDQRAVLAGADELAVRLVVGEPSPPVRCLHLAERPPKRPQRRVRYAEPFGWIVDDHRFTLTPAQEGDRLRGALVDGVVGRVP